MDQLLREWDGESVIVQCDRTSGAWIFIAIHSTRLGPATGGTRMKAYPDTRAALQDALRLAASMTLKFAAVDFPFGGGKAVIAVPPELSAAERPPLLRRYGALIHQLGGLYRTGPDVGTGPEDMDIIAETGAPYVFSRTTAAGGAGPSAPATALGAYNGIRVVLDKLFGNPSPAGRRILVQGAGSVGGLLIEHLRESGAVVLFTDVNLALVRRYRDDLGLPYVEPERALETECDIFSPCALGGVLNARAIARLRCRGVVGAANNQLSCPEDAERLTQRRILYAPDFVVNVGGAMAITGREALGWSPEQADQKIAESVCHNLQRIFEIAQSEKITTDAAARRIAQERLARVRPAGA